MSEAQQKDTRDLETKLRQDLGLLEWQIRDLMPIIESHYTHPTHPVDGELREQVLERLGKSGYRHALTDEERADELMQLFAAHLQAAVQEKENEIVKLRADITYAIGRFQGMEMDSAYLERRYPELKQLTQPTPKPTERGQ